MIDTSDFLCVPDGTTYPMSGDKCYQTRITILGTITVNGAGSLTLRSPEIFINKTGSISANGAGYAGGALIYNSLTSIPPRSVPGNQGSGPGGACAPGPGGDPDTCSNEVGVPGSGGSYGGTGGEPSATRWPTVCDICTQPNVTLCRGLAAEETGSDSGTDLDMGSGGSASSTSCFCPDSSSGGSGGGKIILVGETVNIDGTVQANGASGTYHGYIDCYSPGSGGGSGGGIAIRADVISGSGTVSAKGGNGGVSPGKGYGYRGFSGGSGGGGRIKLFYASQSLFAGTLDVSGGASVIYTGGPCNDCEAGTPGTNGTTYVGPATGIYASFVC